jgi:hypothetical protein
LALPEPISPAVAAVAVFEVVKPKIDDEFTRARLVVFDSQAAAFLNPGEADYAVLEGVANAIESVDRLVRYYQHLDTLLDNFVSLRD